MKIEVSFGYLSTYLPLERVVIQSKGVMFLSLMHQLDLTSPHVLLFCGPPWEAAKQVSIFTLYSEHLYRGIVLYWLEYRFVLDLHIAASPCTMDTAQAGLSALSLPTQIPQYKPMKDCIRLANVDQLDNSEIPLMTQHAWKPVCTISHC